MMTEAYTPKEIATGLSDIRECALEYLTFNQINLLDYLKNYFNKKDSIESEDK